MNSEMHRFRDFRYLIVFGGLALAACTESGEGGAAGMGGMGGTAGNGGTTGTQFPCTEQGIRDAISRGGGPLSFSCDESQVVVTETEIEIDADVILDGKGDLIVDGNNTHRVFSVVEGVTVELRGLAIRRGRTPPDRDGGGILNLGTLAITDCRLFDNFGEGCGGGIHSSTNATLSLARTAISSNTAALGGGICSTGPLTVMDSAIMDNATFQFDGQGGGIFSGGPLTIANSTVAGNAGTVGGGVFSISEATFLNATVSTNDAERGGGVYAEGPATVAIGSSTFVENTAVEVGSAVALGGPESSVEVVRSLIEGECAQEFGAPSPSSGGYNIESPGSTCGFDQATDRIGVSAEQLNLGPLADNGGPTQTHALLSVPTASVALDAIPQALCGVDIDQRGESRPQGDACDVGAFELEANPNL